jgi:chromate reductase
MRVLAISGSLRAGSYNSQLLDAAERELPPGIELVRYEELKQVPPFDEDDEREPVDEAVARLRRAVEEADAILIATPEYNSSIPGQLKNALDWLSRPKGGAALTNKIAAVIGASPSMFGAVWAQAEARKVLGASGARVIDRELAVAQAAEQFGPDGALVDGELRAELRQILLQLEAEWQQIAAVAA